MDAAHEKELSSGENPLCPHFGDCGGCQAQDVPYARQVAAKGAMLEELLRPWWDEPIPVSGSPEIWHYRNKVDPSFAPKRYETAPPPDFTRETVLGYKRTGRWFWPLDIETCLIAPKGMAELVAAVRAWYTAQDLRAYDTRSHTGFLRTLLVREGKRTGERMVVLITTPGAFDAGRFVEAVQGAFPAQSIQRGISTGKAEVTAAEHLEVLHGAPVIQEALHIPDGDSTRALRFQISPFSFFQTNTLATEQLYGALRAWVRRVAPGRFYDLYGGAGGIAFSCADLVAEVDSVESVPEASADGAVNAGLNQIESVRFHTEKVENYLRRVLEGEGLAKDCAVIVDPSRAGMHPKALRRLVQLAPPHVLYVSCNPKIFARELPLLLEGYALESLQGFDLFPHTRHVELVAALRRK